MRRHLKNLIRDALDQTIGQAESSAGVGMAGLRPVEEGDGGNRRRESGQRRE